MSTRSFLVFQFAFWLAAAFLLFLYGLQYGHWQIALIRHLYFPVLAFAVSFGLAAIYRTDWFRARTYELGVTLGISIAAGLATALVLNPITFALAESGWLHRPSRILSTDTLYFALFYFIWSLIFLRLDRTPDEAGERGQGAKPTGDAHKAVLTVGSGDDLRNLNVADLECLIADGDYVELVTTEKGYFKKASLTGLLGELDPAQFTRVHRSAAVNRSKVSNVAALGRGAFEITLVSGRKVTSSRGYKDAVAELLPSA